MAESTARRERGEPASAPLATYLWEVPQKPVAVRLAFDFIDRMEREVIENFRSLTSQGSEIGGVLLGSLIPGSPTTVTVLDYESVPCDYSRGPLYRLSDADLARFERVIEQHATPGGMPVTGFFRAHSRKGLSLDADDLAFLDARFRAPHHIALLVRPFATKTSVGGLFIREDGVMHGEASYLEFPFRSSQLTPSLWTPVEAAPAPPPAPQVSAPVAAPPAPKPVVRPQVVPIGSRREAAVPAPSVEVKMTPPPPVDRTERKVVEPKPPAPAAEVKVAPPVRPAAPEPKPAAKEVKPAAEAKAPAPVVEPKSAPAKPAAEKPVIEKPVFSTLSGTMEAESRGSGKLVMVIAGIALVLAAAVVLFLYPGVLMHPRPTAPVSSTGPELKLLVEPSGTDLLLTWNKNSPAVINATHGVLSINDGDRHENYDMDGKQLQTGSIVYTPVTGDVSFNMEVTGPNQSKTVTESVRSLRTRPSPMPEGGKPGTATPATAKPAQPGTTPAETATATPAEPAPAVPAKAAPKAFNAPLAQRLRPASPDEIASLGAEPGAPAAGVNVNPNLSVPFGNAPVPVAPAPPTQPKKASGGKVAPAQLTYRREPEYPTAARQLGAHGIVVLDATIGKDGRVTAVKVISGHPLLVNAAKAAVMQWHYKPTLLDGQPVENTDRISLNFVAAH